MAAAALRRIAPEHLADLKLDLWILYHPDDRWVARVRRFTEDIAQAVTADLDHFEGRRPLQSDGN
ncbi:MAG: hypothetical protein AAF495_21850 [Pseudomonadota bacterium]